MAREPFLDFPVSWEVYRSHCQEYGFDPGDNKLLPEPPPSGGRCPQCGTEDIMITYYDGIKFSCGNPHCLARFDVPSSPKITYYVPAGIDQIKGELTHIHKDLHELQAKHSSKKVSKYE